ncbi:MAG: hypothetical protein R3C03_17145 [Pirellulaceae bacterium]
MSSSANTRKMDVRQLNAQRVRNHSPATQNQSGGQEAAIPTLYSDAQIGTLAFLAGPLAGFALLAINFSRLRMSDGVVGAITLGVLTTAALVIFGVLLPELAYHVKILPSLAIALGLKKFSGDNFKNHYIQQTNAGKKPSWFEAILIGIIALGCIMVPAMFLV